MRQSAPRSASGFVRRYASVAYLAVGICLAVVYSLDLADPTSDLVSAVIGFGAVIALAVGPRWHGVQPTRPWTLLSLAAGIFLVGIIVRPWAADQTGIKAFASDAFTVPGYLLMIAGLLGLIRARGGFQRHALTDGLIVGVGAGLTSILLLAFPAASVPDRAASVSVMAGIYPMFDVVLLLLLVNLAFTTAVRQPSFLLLVAMMTLLLIGDVSYAIIGVWGELEGPRWMDLLFLLGFTTIGAAALHPSVVELSRARPLPVQPWSWQRLLLIGPAVIAPFVLIPLVSRRSDFDLVLVAVGGAVIVGLLIIRAISAVQAYAEAQRRAEYQASHDQLTGLPNRAMLAGEVDRMLAARPARADQLWMFYLDLDGFKLVNDSWGHAAGDQLIAEVACRLQEVVATDATVARVGGDEFVIARVCDESEAVAFVEVVLECFADPLQMRTAEVVISASVGVVGVSVDEAAETTAESLMRDADTAMYQAKSEGPGKWTMFNAAMHERVRERVEIELALRHALAQNELHLVYQPIVDLRSGRILGAEALSRWDHPTRGKVPPTLFVPIAEDAGLIGRFGRWTLDESLAQLSQWRRDGVVADDFWLSVNVSPRQLRDSTLPVALTDSLMRHGVPARAVVLEITESVMIDSSNVTDQVLFDLRSLGVRIVVDDFGTGYSALGYLRRHPVTGVKIDRAFVGGLGSNAEDEEIVRAVVALSGAMGLTVVAEGVESEPQQRVLESLGVVLGQGQLWSAAMPPGDFVAQWSEQRARSAVAGS